MAFQALQPRAAIDVKCRNLDLIEPMASEATGKSRPIRDIHGNEIVAAKLTVVIGRSKALFPARGAPRHGARRSWCGANPPGTSSRTRASLSLGIGHEWPLAKSSSVRLELRGYSVLLRSEGGFFCASGCTVFVRGETLTQAEAARVWESGSDVMRARRFTGGHSSHARLPQLTLPDKSLIFLRHRVRDAVPGRGPNIAAA